MALFTYPIAILAKQGGEIVTLSELVVLVLKDGFLNTPEIEFDYRPDLYNFFTSVYI